MWAVIHSSDVKFGERQLWRRDFQGMHALRWAQLKPNIEDHCNKLLEILPERLPSPVEKHTPIDAKKRIHNAREIILEMKQLLKMTVS
jgi:hypothetical protein